MEPNRSLCYVIAYVSCLQKLTVVSKFGLFDTRCVGEI